MKKFTAAMTILALTAFFTGCKKEEDHAHHAKNIFTMSNQAAGNSILVFENRADGSLQLTDSFATGGTGTGSALGSQGALTLSRQGNWLFAVNAGSNEVSAFKVKEHQLQLTGKVSSGGNMPVSVTSYRDWVYVLNSGDATIAGFTISSGGTLTPIANSIRQLSGKLIAPAEISFSDDGTSLIITEKSANKIVSYQVSCDGTPGTYHEFNSASPTRFGFAVGRQGYVFVSEAVQSNLSVYQVTNTAIHLASGPVTDNQKAACWVVLTKNGQYAYVANASSNTISGYRVNSSYGVELLNSDGVTATTGNGPIDEALNSNSKFLYVLNSGSHTIRSFEIHSDGSLQYGADTGVLPTGTAGLAAD